jgi:hypothetical protein
LWGFSSYQLLLTLESVTKLPLLPDGLLIVRFTSLGYLCDNILLGRARDYKLTAAPSVDSDLANRMALGFEVSFTLRGALMGEELSSTKTRLIFFVSVRLQINTNHQWPGHPAGIYSSTAHPTYPVSSLSPAPCPSWLL